MSSQDTRHERAQPASGRAARPFTIWTALSYHTLLFTPLLFKEPIPPAAGAEDRLTPQRALAILRNPLTLTLVALLIASSLVVLWHNGGLEAHEALR